MINPGRRLRPRPGAGATRTTTPVREHPGQPGPAHPGQLFAVLPVATLDFSGAELWSTQHPHLRLEHQRGVGRARRQPLRQRGYLCFTAPAPACPGWPRRLGKTNVGVLAYDVPQSAGLRRRASRTASTSTRPPRSSSSTPASPTASPTSAPGPRHEGRRRRHGDHLHGLERGDHAPAGDATPGPGRHPVPAQRLRLRLPGGVRRPLRGLLRAAPSFVPFEAEAQPEGLQHYEEWIEETGKARRRAEPGRLDRRRHVRHRPAGGRARSSASRA